MKRVLFFVLSALVLSSCININDMINTQKQDVVVYGVVADACDGSPLANATVRDAVEELRSVGSTITGSDGSYEFHISATSGMTMLVAEKDNYESQEANILLSGDKNDRQKHVDFKLLRLTIEYRGIVTDSNGNPIPNAKVYATILKGSSIKTAGSTFTNTNGKFILSVPNQEYDSWTYYVTASCDGYQNKTESMGHTPNDNGKNVAISFQLIKE